MRLRKRIVSGRVELYIYRTTRIHTSKVFECIAKLILKTTTIHKIFVVHLHKYYKDVTRIGRI